MLEALINNKDLETKFEPEIILNENISAPIDEGTTLGKIKYTINGVDYETDLIASHSVIKSKFLDYIFYIILAILVLLIIYKTFFVYFKIKNIRK